MAEPGYRDELFRALARPDVTELRRAIEAYRKWSRLTGREASDFFGNVDAEIEIFYRCSDDPDLGLALVSLAASIVDDPRFLFLVAAGPLEDMLQFPSAETIDRVVAEARKNARFRWMLTGVFLHTISDEARPRIVNAIGSMTESDTMPALSS